MSSGGKSSGSWNFQLTGDGWWTWRQSDVQGNEISACHQPYRYFHEAVADARRCGFRGGDAEGKQEAGCSL